jgi:hypothetical protein
MVFAIKCRLAFGVPRRAVAVGSKRFVNLPMTVGREPRHVQEQATCLANPRRVRAVRVASASWSCSLADQPGKQHHRQVPQWLEPGANLPGKQPCVGCAEVLALPIWAGSRFAESDKKSADR